MTLDINKPIRTRDGREVRILCTDATGLINGETIVALVAGCSEPMYYHSDGRWTSNPSAHDLVNYEPVYSRVLSLYRVTKEGVSELAAYPLDVVIHSAASLSGMPSPSKVEKLGDFRVTIDGDKLIKVDLL